MLEKMTESLFAETMKRIAEDVWKNRFEALASKLGNDWRYTDKVTALMTDVLLEVVKKDDQLRAALVAAITSAANAYFSVKAKP